MKSEEWKVKSEQRSVISEQRSLIIDHWTLIIDIGMRFFAFCCRGDLQIAPIDGRALIIEH